MVATNCGCRCSTQRVSATNKLNENTHLRFQLFLVEDNFVFKHFFFTLNYLGDDFFSSCWPTPSKFFSVLQSYCSCLSVVLLSYDSSSTHIRWDGWEKFGRDEGSHREVYQEFQLSYDIFRRWCQELFRPQVPCTPSLHYQLLTLHQHRANNQYRTANQI